MGSLTILFRSVFGNRWGDFLSPILHIKKFSRCLSWISWNVWILHIARNLSQNRTWTLRKYTFVSQMRSSFVLVRRRFHVNFVSFLFCECWLLLLVWLWLVHVNFVCFASLFTRCISSLRRFRNMRLRLVLILESTFTNGNRFRVRLVESALIFLQFFLSLG